MTGFWNGFTGIIFVKIDLYHIKFMLFYFHDKNENQLFYYTFSFHPSDG